MEPSSPTIETKNAPEGKGGLKKSRVADILTRFLRWRPSLTDLQDRNIIKGNVDATKSALERNQNKKKLANLFVQYETEENKTTHPQYGIDPTALAEMYPDQPFGIPRVLSACFAYIEKHLHFEGLFRVTGSHIQITTLRISVENGNFDVIAKCAQPQTITGMVSLFFRQLPQPLIPYALFTECMRIGALAKEEEKIESLRKLFLDELPPANYRIMIAFMRLLKKIAQNSAANMMTASNLGLVWGPTLLQDKDPMSSMVGDNLTRSNLLVELMIAQYDTIFPHDPKQFPTSPPNSPPPQRPPPPTIAPTSPIISRQATVRALSQSSDAISLDGPASSSPIAPRLTSSGTIPPNLLPPTIVTPSRPPVAARSRPYATIGVVTTPISDFSGPPSPQTPPPPAPPPMPPPQRITPPPRATPPPRPIPPRSNAPLRANAKPPSVAPPPAPISVPVSVSPSSTPQLSPTLSTSPPPLSLLSSSPVAAAPLSPMGRPPRPPRFNTVANFNSPDLPKARPRGVTEGSALERYDSSPQLFSSSSSDLNSDDPPKAELSSSPIRYTTRTIGTKPQVKFAPSPKVPPKPGPRPPPNERMRAESYVN